VSTLSTRRGEQLDDRAKTLRNRARMESNRNLLFWYLELYRDQFKNLSHSDQLSILEIGSGTSPLKRFHSNVVTSDILELDYLDLVFDCHEIDKLAVIEDNSLDVITLTNVLHHLKSPIVFLNSAAAKLKPGGNVIATEPYFSVVSSLIFKYLHHEPVAIRISQPGLDEGGGPLVSANIALPWLIFCRRRDWLQRLNENYDITHLSVRPFTALSYMITGGISHKLPVPHFLYRAIFPVDLALSRYFPWLCASFFTLTLTRR
jgi:SAM-dependent methyltransferase